MWYATIRLAWNPILSLKDRQTICAPWSHVCSCAISTSCVPVPSLPFFMCICGNVCKSWNLCPCWKTWFAVYSPPLKEIRPVPPDASQGTDADSIRFINTDPGNKSRFDWVSIGLAHLNAICLTHSWPVCSMQALNLNQSLSAIKWNNGGVERALKLGLEARLAP